MLIDTHAHLDYTDFDPDRDAILTRAYEAGVHEIISIGTDLESSQAAVALVQSHSAPCEGKPLIWATVGIHPCAAQNAPPDFCSSLRALASGPGIVGLGEIGLDYHRLPDLGIAEYKERQAKVFVTQLELAAELKLNVVIHERDAWTDTLELLRPYTGRVRGVFHCFGGTIDRVHELIDLGHLVSFTGIVSFKNARQVHETAQQVPPGSFMVETDCPYLAPAPYRGKRCEPAHTARVAEILAELRQKAIEEIAEETTKMARGFFKF